MEKQNGWYYRNFLLILYCFIYFFDTQIGRKIIYKTLNFKYRLLEQNEEKPEGRIKLNNENSLNHLALFMFPI